MSLLSNLQRIDTPNPRDIGAALVLADKNNKTFVISNATFVALGLDKNGLTQMSNPDTSDNSVYLLVEPGDSAAFFKNNKRGENKKKRFKNIQLYQGLNNLQALNKGDKFTFEEVEPNLYKVVPVSKELAENQAGKFENAITSEGDRPEPLPEQVTETSKETETEVIDTQEDTETEVTETFKDEPVIDDDGDVKIDDEFKDLY